MKGLVFGLTFADACDKLNDIRINYALYHIPIESERKTKHEYAITFKNGDYWRAVPACENRRGCKANVAYIDHRIDEDFIPIIMNCIAVGPWNATHYY